ncbi:MAG: sigma-54-dependent Fis family transcriptional regulator, partial [Methanobacteriota archaeon]
MMSSQEIIQLRDYIRELERKLKFYRSLNHVLGSLCAETRLKAVLQRIINEALKLCDADQGVILLLGNNDGSESETVVREGQENNPILDHFLNTLVTGWVTHNKRPLRINNLKTIFGKQVEKEKYASITSLMGVPIISDHKVLGIINLVSTRPGFHFTEEAEEFLSHLAGQCIMFISNAKDREELFKEAQRLRQEVEHRYARHGLIGKSPAMQKVFNLLDKVIPTDARILLEGESGTGKERIARAIHYSSNRRTKPFVAVDCGALPANLLESELFGFVKGAFTGAISDRKGLFEEADGGTLFLDEIVNMSPEIQAKFLRVIQEGEFRPLGTSLTRKVDVRIIAAASENLREKVAEGKFREDLFFRLNVVNLRIPPLRERREDIILLANHFLQVMNERYGKHLEGFAPQTLTLMENYSWPGNVRELENLIERLVILAEPDLRIIPPQYLPDELHSHKEETFCSSATPSPSEELNIREKKAAYEKEILKAALEKHGWNQSAAA